MLITIIVIINATIVIPFCVFVPFGFVLINKIVGNPALSNFSHFMQYLIGLPVSTTIVGILITYPFFQNIINKWENVFKQTDEFKNINSSICDKELLRDVKEKEYNKVSKFHAFLFDHTFFQN